MSTSQEVSALPNTVMSQGHSDATMRSFAHPLAWEFKHLSVLIPTILRFPKFLKKLRLKFGKKILYNLLKLYHWSGQGKKEPLRRVGTAGKLVYTEVQH